MPAVTHCWGTTQSRCFKQTPTSLRGSSDTTLKTQREAHLDLVDTFPLGKILQSSLDLSLMVPLNENGCIVFTFLHSIGSMEKEADVQAQTHLNVQHLVEDGVGQAFPHVPLVLFPHQLLLELLVGDNAPTPGDL